MTTPPADPTGGGGFQPTKAKPVGTGGGRRWFGGLSIVVLLIAVVALFFVFKGGGGGSSASPAIGDHIHAAYGINVCGTYLADPPEFLTEAGTDDNYAGLHTHGDGLIHVEPTDPADTGDNATVGRYFQYGGGALSEDSITLFDGNTLNAGDPCVPGGPPTELRWSVNGDEQDGNPGDHHIEDGDVIVIALIPEGDDLAALGEPPSTPKLADPTAGEPPPPTGG
jgi:hypothetical protein